MATTDLKPVLLSNSQIPIIRRPRLTACDRVLRLFILQFDRVYHREYQREKKRLSLIPNGQQTSFVLAQAIGNLKTITRNALNDPQAQRLMAYNLYASKVRDYAQRRGVEV